MSKKKYKTKKIAGEKVAVKIEKDSNRELFPRPTVFLSKKEYNRSREKANLRKEW